MNERILLEDLARKAFPLAKFKTLLEDINCQPAMNVFQDASKFSKLKKKKKRKKEKL